MNDTTNELVPYDEVRDWRIYQRLIFAAPLVDIALEENVPVQHVLDIRENMPPSLRPQKMAPSTRKELQLARLDVATKAVMVDVEKGDLQAIDTLLKVQKREASLLGLDAPVTNNTNVAMVQVEIKYSNPNFNRDPDTIDVTPNSPWREPEPDRPAIPGKLFGSDPLAPDPATRANRSS